MTALEKDRARRSIPAQPRPPIVAVTSRIAPFSSTPPSFTYRA